MLAVEFKSILRAAMPVTVAISLGGPSIPAILFLMTGCAHQAIPTPPSVPNQLELRLQNLDARVDRLERRENSLPAAPLRSREEIEKNIQSLEIERVELLQRYTSAHPRVRDIDLQIKLLRGQLEMLGRDQETAK